MKRDATEYARLPEEIMRRADSEEMLPLEGSQRRPRKAVTREASLATRILALLPAFSEPSFEYSRNFRCFVLVFLRSEASDADVKGHRNPGVSRQVRFIPARFDSLGFLGYLTVALAAPFGLFLDRATHTRDIVLSGVVLAVLGLLILVSRPRIIRPDLRLLLKVAQAEAMNVTSSGADSMLREGKKITNTPSSSPIGANMVDTAVMAVSAAARTSASISWRIILAATGVLTVAAAAALEIVTVLHHSTSTVTKIGGITTTVTGPPAPASALVTACLGAGVLLLLAAAFFNRISKVTIPGVGEIDFETSTKIAGKAAAKSGGDAAKAAEIYKGAVWRAASLVGQRAPTITRVSSSARVGWNTESALDDQTLQQLVDEAARDDQ
jgi:hypothetical protein